MRPAYENQQALKAQIVAHVARGYRLHQVAALPGMPSAITITRWQRADPGFAAEMKTCRMYARGLRWESRGWFRFDPVWAEMFLERVRQVGMTAAVRTPGQPCRNQVNRWRKVRPEFDAELDAAKRWWRRPGRRPLPYDEAIADRIILKLIAGVRLRALRKADPRLPGAPTITRWRREHPEFDGALRMTMQGAHRLAVRAAAARRDRLPELAPVIAARIAKGASLKSLGQSPDLPRAGALYGWIRRDAAFARSVQRACEIREFRAADRVLTLARSATPRTAARVARQIAAIRRRQRTPERFPGAKRWGVG